MQANIRLIVGLGNPGAEYQATRHNAGAWFAEALVDNSSELFKLGTKFKGSVAKFQNHGRECHILIPSTFMNHSGQSVAAFAKYFRISPEEILVAHDELDLPVGTVRLKFDGGHGGHNGLRDIINHLHSKAFHRLRIGIGHPGNPKEVTNYVLKKPSNHDRDLIDNAIMFTLSYAVPDIIAGKLQRAMKTLHTKSEEK